MKKLINYISRAGLWQKNSFGVKATFNKFLQKLSFNRYRFL